MKKYKVRGLQTPDCAASMSQTIKTATGVEQVNINLGTGEITYGPDACVDPRLVREAVEGAGYKLEEEEDGKG